MRAIDCGFQLSPLGANRACATRMWIAVIGTRKTGRQSVARRLETAIRDAGHRVGGFHQEARWTETSPREVCGYDLVDAATGERHALARKSGTPDMCEWGFSEQAFPKARAWLEKDACARFAVAGRLEAAERGHWPAIRASLDQPGFLILSVRPNVLASVTLRLPDPAAFIELPASDAEVSDFILGVVELLDEA